MSLEILLNQEVYEEVCYLVAKSPVEISGVGLGHLEEAVDGTVSLCITKQSLLKQENSAATTDIDPAALGALEYEWRNEKGSICWWWHSHVNMGAFYSREDRDTLTKLGGKGWFTGTVLNKKHESKSFYSQAEPVKLLVEIPLFHRKRELDQASKERLDASYAACIQEKKWGSQQDWQNWPDWAGNGHWGRPPNGNGGSGLEIRPGYWLPPSAPAQLQLSDKSAAQAEAEFQAVCRLEDLALDGGLSSKEADRFVEMAERLLEDGKSIQSVEDAIIQRVLAARRPKKGAKNVSNRNR